MKLAVVIVVLVASSFAVSIVSAGDRLVFAQALWRHGDRTPSPTYQNDPYQEAFWGLPWGELTTWGMKQSFRQGQRLKRRYIDEYGLLSKDYKRQEISVRSSDTHRCIQSAFANLAGFYTASNGTHPSDVVDWPAAWTPVPVHTMPGNEDPELKPAENCPKAKELAAERLLHKEFLEFVASKWELFAEIAKNTGNTTKMEFEGLSVFYGVVKIERDYYNLTLPAWITDKLFNDLEDAIEKGMDYVFGAPGFGRPADNHFIKLFGGFLLTEWLGNFERAAGGHGGEKYKAYSAHDATVTALLMTLGAKTAILGGKNPDYASTVVGELWQREEDKQFYVKFLFAPDSYSELAAFTRHIPGCPADSDLCPLSTFAARSKPFLAKDHDIECGFI